MTFHCVAELGHTIKEIHRATATLEAEIRDELPIFSQIIIHVEPIIEHPSDEGNQDPN